MLSGAEDPVATKKTDKTGEVLARLHDKYKNPKYELNWTNAFELLVATILAAQATDERINQLTKTLFVKYKQPADYLKVPVEELEEDIKPSGFFRNKAKSIRGACQVLIDDFGGEVPKNIDDLIKLPGVARKTANVVLNTVWNIPSGVIVDTHVGRVSQRLGLTKSDKTEAIEEDLMRMLPKEEWTFFGPAMVLHGRYTCVSKAPKCGECSLADVCDKVGVKTEVAPAKRKGR
jgi:endonuclease III